MKKEKLFIFLVFTLTTIAPLVFAKDVVHVVASTPDLAALAQAVGGDLVKVESLIKGTQDPHNIEVLPSYMVKLRNADVFLIIGMDLDQWAFPLRDGSRNARLLTVDCSKTINRLHVPTSKIDASYGDIHIYGNPHYWLDPQNGRIILETILDALAQVSPENAPVFQQNVRAYSQKLEEKMKEWQAAMAPYREHRIIFYHDSWPYFQQRFGLEIVDFIEPKPGIVPSPSHTARLLEEVGQQQIKVIAMEPFYDERVPDLISRQTGAHVVVVAPSVGSVKGVDDYIQLFDYNVKSLVDAFSK